MSPLLRAALLGAIVWLCALFFAVPASAACPAGFERVPANPPYHYSVMCLQKEEAKNPITGLVWNWISFANAQAVCQIFGGSVELPTSVLYTSVARQAENVAANWTGGSVGSGSFKTDLTIANGLGGWSTFLNIGDGVWEHARGTSPAEHTGMYVYLFDPADTYTFTVNGVTGNSKLHFGPSGTAYGPVVGPSFGRTITRASTYILRGGDDDDPGAFGSAMNHSGEAASDVGFRCGCAENECGS